MDFGIPLDSQASFHTPVLCVSIRQIIPFFALTEPRFGESMEVSVRCLCSCLSVCLIGCSVCSADVVSLVAGGPFVGAADGCGVAQFARPKGLLVAGDGRIFCADTSNHRIRCIDPKNNNTVSTVAGSGKPLPTDGPALSSGLPNPVSLAFDPLSPIPESALYIACSKAVRRLSLPLGKRWMSPVPYKCSITPVV
jgi:hypothetical protein